MAKGDLSGSAFGAFGSLLIVAAVIMSLVMAVKGPDVLGLLITVILWVIGIAVYVMKWRS